MRIRIRIYKDAIYQSMVYIKVAYIYIYIGGYLYEKV